MQLQIKRINDCIIWVENNASKYEKLQSLTILIEDSGKLIASLAFINNQMAIAKRILNEKKSQEYLNVIASIEANNKKLGPSVIKDYVASKCYEEQYNYDLSERCSRTITHTLDTLRTCISALKEELKLTAYYNN